LTTLSFTAWTAPELFEEPEADLLGFFEARLLPFEAVLLDLDDPPGRDFEGVTARFFGSDFFALAFLGFAGALRLDFAVALRCVFVCLAICPPKEAGCGVACRP
jgi:hypothetical protein